jgi:hypothetical protein
VALIDSAAVRGLLAESVSGLRVMFDSDRQEFCERVVQTNTGLSPQGNSERYTAMTLLGLNRYERAGYRSRFPVRELALALVQDCRWARNVGDAGLLMWVCAEIIPDSLQDAVPRASGIAGRQHSREVRARSTMELAWFLTGMAKAVLRNPSQRKHCDAAAHFVFDLLKRNQGRSGLFGHRAAGLAPQTWRGRIGSFADQVYPIYAFTAFAEAFGVQEALACARDCADALCRVQGPLGQWWWHYDSTSGRVVQRYPVYSVHQEGMAPMALLALGHATGRSYTDSVTRGLRWIFGRNELGRDMRDARTGLVWRSLRFSSRVRLLQQELRGLGHLGNEGLSVSGLSVLHECRPYELGWLLYALPAYSDILVECER